MVVRFKPNVGRATYRGRLAMSTEADFGASIKAQMNDIVKNYKAFTEHMDSESADILEQALRPTFEKSQERVPYRTGELHDSGYLETRQVRGHASVEIGYARGGHPDYAVFVHENVDIYHAPPTEAKFLERPLAEDEAEIQRRIQLLFAYAAGLDETGGVWHG